MLFTHTILLASLLLCVSSQNIVIRGNETSSAIQLALQNNQPAVIVFDENSALRVDPCDAKLDEANKEKDITISRVTGEATQTQLTFKKYFNGGRDFEDGGVLNVTLEAIEAATCISWRDPHMVFFNERSFQIQNPAPENWDNLEPILGHYVGGTGVYELVNTPDLVVQTIVEGYNNEGAGEYNNVITRAAFYSRSLEAGIQCNIDKTKNDAKFTCAGIGGASATISETPISEDVFGTGTMYKFPDGSEISVTALADNWADSNMLNVRIKMSGKWGHCTSGLCGTFFAAPDFSNDAAQHRVADEHNIFKCVDGGFKGDKCNLRPASCPGPNKCSPPPVETPVTTSSSCTSTSMSTSTSTSTSTETPTTTSTATPTATPTCPGVTNTATVTETVTTTVTAAAVTVTATATAACETVRVVETVIDELPFCDEYETSTIVSTVTPTSTPTPSCTAGHKSSSSSTTTTTSIQTSTFVPSPTPVVTSPPPAVPSDPNAVKSYESNDVASFGVSMLMMLPALFF